MFDFKITHANVDDNALVDQWPKLAKKIPILRDYPKHLNSDMVHFLSLLKESTSKKLYAKKFDSLIKFCNVRPNSLLLNRKKNNNIQIYFYFIGSTNGPHFDG